MLLARRRPTGRNAQIHYAEEGFGYAAVVGGTLAVHLWTPPPPPEPQDDDIKGPAAVEWSAPAPPRWVPPRGPWRLAASGEGYRVWLAQDPLVAQYHGHRSASGGPVGGLVGARQHNSSDGLEAWATAR